MNNVITDIANGDGFSQRNGWFGWIARQTVKLSDFTSHPVVGVVNGEVTVLGKARGAKHGNNLLMEQITLCGGIDFDKPFSLGYTGLDDTLIKQYIESSKSVWEGHAKELPISTIGGTIGTHVGPGAVAVAFFSPDEAGQD